MRSPHHAAFVAALIAAGGAASAAVKVRTFTIVNATGQAGSSLFVNFGNTVGGLRGANTAEVFDATGGYTGWFGQATATNNFNNPNLPLTAYHFTQPLDGSDVARPVPSGDRSTFTVAFPNAANPAVFFTRYRNAAGQNINAGRTLVVSAAAEFRRDDATGLCSVEFAPEAGRSLLVGNVRVWSGMTEQQLLTFDPSASAPTLEHPGPFLIPEASSTQSLDFGFAGPEAHAVVTYSLWFSDGGGPMEYAGEMTYGAMVPAPGMLGAAAVFAGMIRRRSRKH